MTFFASFLLLTSALQAQKTAVNSGPWGDDNTWSPAGVPAPGDVVSIQSGITVTVDANAAAAAIQINNGASSLPATLTLSPGVQLTVTGFISLGTGTSGGHLILGSGTISTAGFAAATTATNSWDPGTGTVILTGNNSLPALFTGFYNLTVAGGTPGDDRSTRAGAPLSISNNLSIAANTILDMASFALALPGATLVNIGRIETQNTSATPLPAGMTWGDVAAGRGAVLYNAPGGGQTIVSGTYVNLYLLHAAGGESSASGDIVIAGEVAALSTGTTFNMGTFQLASHPLGGIGSQTNVGTIRTQYTGPDLLPLPTGRNWGGTVQYDAAGGGQKIVFGTYNNLTVLGNGTDLSSSIVVNGNLVTGAGIAIDMNQETLTGTFDASGHAGNLIVRGTLPFPAGKTFGGTVTYAGTVAQTVRTGHYQNLSINLFRSFDLTLEAGTIGVAGNLDFSAVEENGATFITTGSVFDFNGSSAQTIDVTARRTGPTVPFSFNDVTLSGGGSKTLLAPMSVSGLLTLGNGVLVTSAANLLTLETGATVAGGSTASFVEGPLRRLGTDAFTFPVGGGGVFAPIGISAPGTGGDVTATYIRSNPQALGTQVQTPVVKISACEYWNLQKTGGSNNPTVTLFWSPNSGCNGTGAYVSNPFTLVPVRFNGTAWESLGVSTVSGTGGVNGAGFITSDPATAFDNITLGSTSQENALPVRFISVSAQPRNGTVELHWTTAAEFNVDRYEVQRSGDGRNFSTVGQVTAARPAGGATQYDYTDRLIPAGQEYYRIRAVDADGRITLSQVLRVRTSALTGSLELYPVPVRNGALLLRSDNLVAGTYELRVVDAAGRLLLREAVQHTGGAWSRSLTLPAGIAPGHYQLLLSGADEKTALPFVVQ